MVYTMVYGLYTKPYTTLFFTPYIYTVVSSKIRSSGFLICRTLKKAIMTKIDLGDWPDWIDGHDVMVKLKIAPSTLQRWRITGVLPYSRLNGKCFYRKSDILSLLKENYNGEKEKGEEEEEEEKEGDNGAKQIGRGNHD